MPDNERIGSLEFEASIDTRKLENSGQKVDAAMSKVEKSTRKTEKALTDVEKAAKKADSSFDGLFKRFTLGNIVGNVITTAIFRVTAALAQFARGVIKASSDLQELDSKARIVFADSFPQVQKQVKNIATEVGRASSTILQFATDMGAVISAFGITGPLLDQMSTQFAKLAVDLASFHNSTDEEAFAALRSGITGETEPLKRFGIVLTDTNLQLFAFEKGIKTKILAMNQAQKTALRYAFIMDKTALAQGDAARTADSYANQSRRLGGELKTLQEQLGKAVTPGLANGLSVVSSAIQNVRLFIGLLAQDLKSLFSMLNINIGGTSIGKTIKNAAVSSITAMNPIAGAFLQSGFKSPAQKMIEGRLASARAGEASNQPTILDPLANFDSLGGANGASGGGGADQLKKVAELEEDILKALGEQADANKENLQIRRDDLLLRQKLGVLTARETFELDQINSRMEFGNEKIQDMVRGWEEMQQKIEGSKDRLTDLRKQLKQLSDDLADSLKKVDEDASKSRQERINELVKRKLELEQQMAVGISLDGGQSREYGDILAELQAGGASDAELVQGEQSSNRTPLEQIGVDAQAAKMKLIEEEKAKREEILQQIDLERQSLEKLRAEGVNAQKEIVNAVSDRQVQQDKTFTLIEERQTEHVNKTIAEFNRLKSALAGTPLPTTPTFATGGPVVGPGTETSDSITARLSAGEHVLTGSDVRAMGGHAAVLQFRNDIHRLLPRFANGGPVTNDNSRKADITINNHGRAAESFTDPRRAKWYARTYL